MPKTQSEDDKKHGDKMAPLIERTKRSAGGGEHEGTDDDDAARLEDDDDEDVQDEAVDSDRDIDERE